MATRTARPGKSTTRTSGKTCKSGKNARIGSGGERHQLPDSLQTRLTTNHDVPISDNQNSLKAGVPPDADVVDLSRDAKAFLKPAAARQWDREPRVRLLA